jgi:uncharacterized membrane protein
MVTTVTTVTTVTAIAGLGLTAAISVAAVITLMVFLTSRELIAASQSRLAWRIARFATVGILPLVMVFAVILAVKIAEIL